MSSSRSELDPERAGVVRRLVASTDRVARVSGRQAVRDLLQRVSRGRLGRAAGWLQTPRLNSPWQDTMSGERRGWRERAANDPAQPDDDFAFAVDYRICRPCGLGWVEQPYTREDLQRGGLATAGLMSLRQENPGLSWHTLGGHLSDSRLFWDAVGPGVLGCYQPRDLCHHLDAS